MRRLARAGQMRSFSIGQELAAATGVRFKSAVQRFYRLLHNRRLDDGLCWQALAQSLLAAAGERALVAVDWTEWHSGRRVLTAAVCVGRRAIPIVAKTCPRQARVQSQNTVENAFLRRIADLSALMEQAVLIFDRGFRRVGFIREALRMRRFFIIRLAAKVQVYAQGFTGLLRDHPLRPGQIVDLGLCALRQDARVKARIVGVWAEGQKEPWWLATNLEDAAGRVAECYDRRMAVEEQFRDGKGCRYGIKMKWTKFQDCQQIDRLFLLWALALTAWTLAGWLACLATRRDPTLRLRSKSKGYRRSLVAVGIEAKGAMDRTLRMGHRAFCRLWPPATIRSFAWGEK